MTKSIIYFLLIGIAFFSCKSKTKEEEHNHEHDSKSFLHTVFTDKSELFIEFEPLIVGDSIKFNAHITKLFDYKPLDNGTITITIGDNQAKTGVSNIKGIFNPVIKPSKPGTFQLKIYVKSKELSDTFVINNVKVHDDHVSAIEQLHDIKADAGEIKFLKEQAWKTDFGVKKVQYGNFSEVIKTSGQIMPAQGDEITVAATSNGIVMFSNVSVFAGQQVNQGAHLFTISGSNIIDGNPDVKYVEVKAQFEKAKIDYERAQKLVKDKIVSDKEFQEYELSFKQAKVNYEVLLKNYSAAGKMLYSPMTGYIKNVLIKEGQYVEIGHPIAVISQNRRLIIRADVAQNHWNCLPLIKTANFRTSYDNRVYSLDSLNGRFISFGKSSDNSAFYSPVFFEFDNKGNFFSGSFIEIYLISKPLANILSIPISSLIEEQGNFYVFVQKNGESYEKREVKTGINNGFDIQIISGLQPGDYVVVKGAYQVKLASMSGALPSGHGHEH